jgi:hypothetical protein
MARTIYTIENYDLLTREEMDEGDATSGIA